ncbi:MAG TPA: polysaccharide biosynthesis C-terminal domain-containing protein [Polyangia bacterium]
MIRFWAKLVETAGARGYSLLVGIAVVFVTARVLGPDGRGVLVAAVAWTGLVGSLAGLSLGQVTQHRAQAGRAEGWLARALGTLLVLAAALTLLGLLVSGGVYLATGGRLVRGVPPSLLLLAFGTVPFLIWEEYGSNLLTITGRLRTYNLGQVAGRTLTLGLLVVLVILLRYGVGGALVALVGGQAVVALVGIGALWRGAGGRPRFSFAETRALLGGALRLHLNTVGAFVLAQANVLMLNHYRGQAEVAWYQLALQMIMVLVMVPQATTLVLYSRMAELGPDRLWPEQRRRGLEVLGAMVVLGTVAFFAGPPLITALAGPGFAPTGTIFRQLLPALVGLSLAQIMTPQWIGRGLFATSTALTLATVVVNLAANVVLIPRYGIAGAVWATLIAYVGVAATVQAVFAVWCEGRSRRARPVETTARPSAAKEAGP